MLHFADENEVIPGVYIPQITFSERLSAFERALKALVTRVASLFLQKQML